MQALGMHRTTPGLTSSSRCSPPACPARLSAHAARQGKPAALPCSASAPPSVMQRTEVIAGHGATTTIEKPRPAEAASATHPTSTSTSTSLLHNLAPAPAPSVRELSPANFDQAVSSEGLVLVDFYTDYCGPCKLMHAQLDKLQTAFKKIKFMKYNCGLEGHEPLATRQRIRSLPTFRLYYSGKFLEEVTGARPVQLRQMLVHYYR